MISLYLFLTTGPAERKQSRGRSYCADIFRKTGAAWRLLLTSQVK